jgi:hypothetical protein
LFGLDQTRIKWVTCLKKCACFFWACFIRIAKRSNFVEEFFSIRALFRRENSTEQPELFERVDDKPSSTMFFAICAGHNSISDDAICDDAFLTKLYIV